MKRWQDLVVATCAASVTVACWLVPAPLHGLLCGLLLALVILTIFSKRNAMQTTLDSLNAAHLEQLESERRYRALFDAGSDIVLVYAIEADGRPGRLVEVNEAACQSLSYSRAQLLAMTADKLYAPEARGRVQEYSRALSDADALVFETLHVTSLGERLPVEVSARLMQLGGRRLCLAIAHGIAAHKELEGLLRDLSDRDDLTGLLNHRGFFVQVEQIRRRAKRVQSQVLLVYLDVDGLKRVNDELGHAAGDKLVVAAGEALRLAFREDDVVARLGGDEFAAVALLGREDQRLDRQMIAERLERAVRTKRAELGEGYDFSASFGSIVARSDELDDVDELLVRADQQMYAAKRARRREVDAVETFVACIVERGADVAAGAASEPPIESGVVLVAPEVQSGAGELATDVPAARPQPSAREDSTIDQAEMRSRIEETRTRLKVKVFDAMIGGKTALLSRDGGAKPAPALDDATLGGHLEGIVDKALSEEEA